MYYVMIQGDNVAPCELFRTEHFEAAKSVADDHKATTGENCRIESRVMVYTTQTLAEVLAKRARAAEPKPFDGARASYEDGQARLDEARRARVARAVQVGDHTPEPRQMKRVAIILEGAGGELDRLEFNVRDDQDESAVIGNSVYRLLRRMESCRPVT